ncbi:ketopantoate reductase family protein [Methylomagnum sp.]
MKVLVIGTGAIGSFYGSLLARAGAEVSVVARSDYEHVQAHGIEVLSETKLGHYHFRPAAVVRNAAELAEKPDYVLLCVKVVEGADRAALLRNALGPNTAIVLVSNGVEIEDDIAAAFPDHELISGLAFICVTRAAPGEIWHQAYGRLALGNYPSGLSDKTKALCEAFEKSGINAAASPDIVTARWQKCVWNAPFSPLSVLSGGLGTNDILSSQEPLVRAIMEEIGRIAAALGHALPPNIVDRNIDSTYKMPPYKTSMLLDFEAGRPMETEAILGNAVRAGRRAGMEIPYLESIYALMKLRELKLSQEPD